MLVVSLPFLGNGKPMTFRLGQTVSAVRGEVYSSRSWAKRRLGGSALRKRREGSMLAVPLPFLSERQTDRRWLDSCSSRVGSECTPARGCETTVLRSESSAGA